LNLIWFYHDMLVFLEYNRDGVVVVVSVLLCHRLIRSV
jgi:hypothetical protein